MSLKTRAGYDVTEAMWIKEATFGTVPTTGAWKHLGHITMFDPVRRPTYKERIGLGRQYPSNLELMKEDAELSVEFGALLKSVASGAEYEWMDLYALMWGEDDAAATVDLEKHEASMSVGAKLDLATDEYMLVKGAKFQEARIIAEHGPEPIRQILSFLGQKHTHGTVDYVSGTATRKNFPSTLLMKFADTDLLYNGASIIERLQSFEFTMRRKLDKRGGYPAEKTLYSKLSEMELSMDVSITLDFDSTPELNDFMGDVNRDILIKIPSGTGGRQLNLFSCKWREMRKPQRELDLIELRLTASVLGTPTITTL